MVRRQGHAQIRTHKRRQNDIAGLGASMEILPLCRDSLIQGEGKMPSSQPSFEVIPPERGHPALDWREAP